MIETLKWDSAFFNCKIGRYEATSLFNIQEFEDESKGFDLIYVFSKSPLKIPATYKGEKVTYSKLTDHKAINNNTTRFFSPDIDNYNDLLALVYLSGHESRFFKDPFFGEESFKTLYEAWINKNLKNDNECVIVYPIAEKIAGFISYRFNNKNAVIDLLAVSNEHQGKGIGKQLLFAVEQNLEPGLVLSVSTQGANKKAKAFYEKIGFTLTEKLYIYHYVPNPL
jgi:ribosomal protein S18 acetylase RimI-like enzyme